MKSNNQEFNKVQKIQGLSQFLTNSPRSPMWNKKGREYSPFRPLRELNKLYLNDNLVEDANAKDYTDYKNQYKFADKVEKQILDMYVNKLANGDLANGKDFNRFNIYTNTEALTNKF